MSRSAQGAERQASMLRTFVTAALLVLATPVPSEARPIPRVTQVRPSGKRVVVRAHKKTGRPRVRSHSRRPPNRYHVSRRG